jgi:tetratricopeptide (TPR) repeat protein
MRARPIAVSLALLASLAAAPAVAQQPSGAAPKDAPKGAAAGPRKDPAGQTGISPYMEQIVKGQAAFVARDFPGAIAAFQEAIKLDPGLMLGFYRLGEAMLETGKIEDAEGAWTTALGKKGGEDLNAKVLFCMADLRERQKSWQVAKDAWAAYTAFLTGHPKANGYAATAVERDKMIDRRVKDEKDYAVVKERIKKREEERAKEAEENAKKDKLNK